MVSARVLVTLALAALLVASAVTVAATPVHADSAPSDDEEDDNELSEENESDETAESSLGEEATDRIDDDVLRRQQGTNVNEIVAELEAGSGEHDALPEGFRADLAGVLDKYDDRRGNGWTDKLTGDLQGLLENYQGDFASKYRTDDGLPVTELPDGEMSEAELQNEASDRGHAMSGIDWGASVRIRWGGGNGPAVDVKVHAGGKSTPWVGHNDPTEDVTKEFNDIVQGGDEDVSTEGVDDFDPEQKEDTGETTGGDEDETGPTDEGESTSDENEDQKDGTEEQKDEGTEETNDGDGENDESGESSGSGDSNESGGTDENDDGSDSGESDGESGETEDESGQSGESGESGQQGGSEDGTDGESGKKGMPSDPYGSGGGCGKAMLCKQGNDSLGVGTNSKNEVPEECKAMMPKNPGGDCNRPGENDGSLPADDGNDVPEECKAMMPKNPGGDCNRPGTTDGYQPGDAPQNVDEQCKVMMPAGPGGCDFDDPRSPN